MDEPKHEQKSRKGGYQHKNIGNEHGNWSMNAINLICGPYFSLEFYSYFLPCIAYVMSTLSKDSLCLRCLPDGLVKFLYKETHCCVGWMVQSVL